MGAEPGWRHLALRFHDGLRGYFERDFHNRRGQYPSILFVPAERMVVALIGYSRGVSLYVVSDGHRLATATNPEGRPYTFDTGLRGTGTGVGCSQVAGAQAVTLVGLNAAAPDGNPTSAIRRTQVLIDGTTARNGLTDEVPTSPTAATSARTVSCGDLTLEKDGVSPRLPTG